MAFMSAENRIKSAESQHQSWSITAATILALSVPPITGEAIVLWGHLLDTKEPTHQVVRVTPIHRNSAETSDLQRNTKGHIFQVFPAK